MQLGRRSRAGSLEAARAVAAASAAEQAGFGAFLLDATGVPLSGTRPGGGGVGPGGLSPRGDPFVLLGAAAASTEAIRLGACCTAGERPATVLAKVAAGLDVCSGGRALLVLAPGEEDGGIPDGDRLREELEVCRAMLRSPAPSRSGRHYRLAEAWNEPRVAGPRPTPLGLLVPPGPGAAAEGLAEVAAGDCDLALVDLRSAGEGPGPGEEPDPARPGERAGALAAAFARAVAAAGRSPGAVRLLALLGPARSGREELVARAAEACRAAGFAGFLLEWPLGEPLSAGALARWRSLLEEGGARRGPVPGGAAGRGSSPKCPPIG